MSKAIFMAPLPLTLVSATNTLPGYSGDNLANDYLGVVWKAQSVGDASQSFILDLGADLPIDTIALFGLTDATADWTMTIAAATDAQGAFGGSSYSYAAEQLLAGDILPPSGRGRAYWEKPAGGPTSARYWRITITTPANDTAVTVARVAIGQRIQPERNFDFGAAFGIRSHGKTEWSLRAVLLRRRAPRLRSIGVSFANLHRDEVENQVHPLLAALGNEEPILLVTDPAPHAQRQNRIYFGPLLGELGTVWAKANGFQWQANVVDLEQIMPGAVPIGAPTPTPAPSWTSDCYVTGTPRVGEILTAHGGTIVDGAHSGWRWLRDGALISGATGETYMLTTSDLAHLVGPRELASGAGGPGSNDGDPTGPVDPANPDAPSWTSAPTITGTAQQGQTLTGHDGTIVDGTVSARAWLRSGTPISGATGAAYGLVSADVGATIVFQVTATGTGGTSSATSTATSAVLPPAPAWSVAPSIAGTPTEGQTLTGSDGTISNGTVSARAWLRNGTAISGATGATYVLTSADIAATIAFKVTGTGAGGTNSATSAGVGPIASALSLKSGFVHRIDPAAQGVSTNGAAIDTLLDSVAGGTMAKASTNAATYLASAQNGKPGIQFTSDEPNAWTASGNAYAVDRTSNAGLISALDNVADDGWTMHIAVKNLRPNDIRSFLTYNTDDLRRLELASRCGLHDQIDLLVGTLVEDEVYILTIVADPAQNLTRFWVGEMPLAARSGVFDFDGLPSTTGGTAPRLGSIYADGTGYNFDGILLDWVTYASPLVPVDVVKNVRFLNAKFGIANKSKFVLFDGSSLAQGEGAESRDHTVVAQLVTQLDMAPGQIGVFARGGHTWNDRDGFASQLDNLIAYLGAANCKLIAWEGYNTLRDKTGAVAAADALSYINHRVSAGVLAANIDLCTVTGVSTVREGYGQYPAYCTAVAALTAQPGLSAMGIVRLDQDPGNHVGVAGTGGGYYDAPYATGDSVHLTDEGYDYVATTFFLTRVGSFLGV